MQDEASKLGLGPATTKYVLVQVLFCMIDHEPLVKQSAWNHAAACAVTLVQWDVGVNIEEQLSTALTLEHAPAGMPMPAVIGCVLKPIWFVEQLVGAYFVSYSTWLTCDSDA